MSKSVFIYGRNSTSINQSTNQPINQSINQSIDQSINLFVQKCNTHWTGHQGRMQPPLTGARKNKVSKSNKWQSQMSKFVNGNNLDMYFTVCWIYNYTIINWLGDDSTRLISSINVAMVSLACFNCCCISWYDPMTSSCCVTPSAAWFSCSIRIVNFSDLTLFCLLLHVACRTVELNTIWCTRKHSLKPKKQQTVKT